MTDRKITLGQLLTILFLALLPLATERLPSRLSSVGAAAWLCPLLAGGVAVALAALIRPVLGEQGLCRAMERAWGRKAARGLALLFLAWGLYLTSAHAARIGSRLSDSLRASPVLITAAALLLAGWLAAGGLPAFARAGEIFALAVGAGFGLILLFGVFRLQWENVFLFDWGELAQVPGGALSAGGTVAAGGYALLLLDRVEPEKKAKRTFLTRLALLFLLLTAVMVLVLGRLGAPLAAQIHRPFFQMVSGLGFEGVFQRLEALASALWVLGDAALLAFLLLCMAPLLAQTLARPASKTQSWTLTALVFLGSLNLPYWNQVLAGSLLPLGNLIALALLGAVWGLSREKSKNLKKDEKSA